MLPDPGRLETANRRRVHWQALLAARIVGPAERNPDFAGSRQPPPGKAMATQVRNPHSRVPCQSAEQLMHSLLGHPIGRKRTAAMHGQRAGIHRRRASNGSLPGIFGRPGRRPAGSWLDGIRGNGMVARIWMRLETARTLLQPEGILRAPTSAARPSPDPDPVALSEGLACGRR